MKNNLKSLFKKFTFLKLLVLIVIVTVYVISCKKGTSDNNFFSGKADINNKVSDSDESLISDFNRKKFTQENLQFNTDTVTEPYKLFWKIKWNEKLDRIRTDSIDYVYIPINAYYKVKGSTVEKNAVVLNYKKYLVIAIQSKTKKYFLAYVFPENNKTIADENVFSGNIAFKSLETKKYFKSSYTAGQISKKSKDLNSMSAASTYPCTDTYLCSWNFTCFDGKSGIFTVFGKVSVGSCGMPTFQEIYKPYECPTYSQPVLVNSELISHVCPSDIPDPNPQPPIPPPGGPGVGIGNGFNPSNILNGNGTKPIFESPDKCPGATYLWDLSVKNNKETVGVLTADGKFLTIAIVNATGGSFGGLYNYGGKTYYTYPESQGAPQQTYTGMVHSAGQYFIPIAATVHTHIPCLTDGTNGISNMVLSAGDQSLASNFSNIKHYIIGCNAIGSFSSASSSPWVIKAGLLSTTCTSIN